MAIQKIKKQKVNGHYTPIGWREWIYLPNHNDFAIKAKVDTGARTSALHATHIEEYKKNSKTWIRFRLHQSNEYVQIVSRLIKHVNITSSFGDTENRPVIKLKIQLGERSWLTEVTLTTRTRMTYPMLVGRNSLMKKHLIHSHKSYLTGKKKVVKP
ncbi:MAG: RimK/LysX family protein [Candidatus Marinimicrobia bacterium]|jgi:hypothetical protein|nr:RimK/LysX family protein [Candidatus Neomarinimicrobiota bacterium]|tara:strand:- start:1063 stop:1530 length:468 start_codon:yes stop_codon:yes gene_type:complete